jgi:hypothetical protein
MITIGQIIESLQTEIFASNSHNNFEKKCREREEGIKNYIGIIGQIINQHITQPESKENKPSHWKKEKIKSCVQNLIEYAQELFDELNKNKIENYITRQNNMIIYIGSFTPNITLIIFNSYYGAIVNDIYWIKDLTIKHAMKISAGQIDIADLGKNTPHKIETIKNFLEKNNDTLKIYSNHIDTINEALQCYDNKHFKAFNLLLLTSIEGLTRSIGGFLIIKQKLDVNPYSDEYNSLDSFLRKINWKEDFVVEENDLAFYTGTYNRTKINIHSLTELDSETTIKISLKTRLDFLRRRFKENRDLTLHGQETEYNKPHIGFINASALYEVLKTVKHYLELYK